MLFRQPLFADVFGSGISDCCAAYNSFRLTIILAAVDATPDPGTFDATSETQCSSVYVAIGWRIFEADGHCHRRIAECSQPKPLRHHAETPLPRDKAPLEENLKPKLMLLI